MRFRYVVALLLCVAPALVQGQNRSGANQAELERMTQRFAPTPLRLDVSSLSSGDRQALVKLIQAARIVDDLFLKQLWTGNYALLQRLQKDLTPLGRARFHYFWINKGPWSEIDEYKAFLPGVPARKPLGANFYPENMSKQDFERWVSTLSHAEQEQAKGFFTVIHSKDRASKGAASAEVSDREAQFVAVPYSDEYKDELARAATLLKDAAALTDSPSLKKFLEGRADAFLSNDYYESDLAWMELDAPLDVTIGPYETYNDELFGYKAGFEAYVSLRDEQESTKLAVFAKHLQEIENNLPIDPQYRNPKLGAAAPIRVVDEIISAGDGAHGVQTAAYNLPNDDRVVQQKGSKRVMLKNVQEAKFRAVLLPIARRTLSRNAMLDVNFESFFTHILAHELTHGIGPHEIKMGDRETNPRLELKELYSAIEEAKADVTGLFALQYLMDHRKEMNLGNTLPSDEAAQRQLYVTFLASSFRELRFGLHDAHGKGMAMQFNYLLDKGGFVPHGDGTFSVDMTKIKEAVRDLDHDLLTIEAQGDYIAAKKMLDELGVVRPMLKRALGRLQDLPTDIEPIFVTANELVPSAEAQLLPSEPRIQKKRPSRKRSRTR
jgi:hypothetical protein